MTALDRIRLTGLLKRSPAPAGLLHCLKQHRAPRQHPGDARQPARPGQPSGAAPAVTGSGPREALASRWAKNSPPSMLKLGTALSSHLGMYQFDLPMRIISEGTSRHRTTVASRITATARPTPNCLIVGSPLSTKLPNTNTMISAAAVITRALVTSPDVTALRLSSPACTCSSIWLTRKTS